MSRQDSTDEELDTKQRVLWRLIAAGFMTFMVLSILFSAISIYSTRALTDRVDSRDAFVEYINQDSQWTHCQDKENREFFVVIGNLISASLANDDAEILKLTKQLEHSRDSLQNAEDPSVCGPPPSVPKQIGTG